MKDLNDAAFISLFKEACQKCFGHPLSEPLSETESRHLASQIFEATGLVIGAKSLKNYSIHVAGGADVRTENPSVATLDTLARYVANAPTSAKSSARIMKGISLTGFNIKVVWLRQRPGIALLLLMPIFLQ